LNGRNLVAIVDDEEAVRVGLGALMRSADLKAELFASADSFLETDPALYGVVFSDIQMPGRSGLDLLVATRAARPELPVILMTAFPDERMRERAASEGAYRFLTKPCDPDELITLAETLLAAGR
jgi:two-component system response regulator FixJ